MTTVLIADDNKNIREFCKGELEAEGYRVLLARDGLEALRILGSDGPDLVVLDVRMPAMSGLETMRRIRAARRTLPVIFYTAHHKDYLTDLRSWPSIPCVEKSENLRELKQAIAAAVGPGQRHEPDAGDAGWTSSKTRRTGLARVLLADPNRSLMALWSDALACEGFIVATAADGLECVSQLRAYRPDVLVLDPSLPWGGGAGVLAVMHEQADVPRVPVIVIATNLAVSDQEAVRTMLQYPIDEYHAKPFAPRALGRWVIQLLARRGLGLSTGAAVRAASCTGNL